MTRKEQRVIEIVMVVFFVAMIAGALVDNHNYSHIDETRDSFFECPNVRC